jgi:hypothetical protein
MRLAGWNAILEKWFFSLYHGGSEKAFLTGACVTM